MIKILYIISDQKFGGGSRHLLNLIREIDRNNFEPILVTTPSPILDMIKDIKIKTHIVDMKSRIDLKATKNIKNIISDEKPGLIHLHSTRAGLIGAYAAKNAKIPIIYTEHLFTKDYVPYNSIIHHAQLFAFRKLSKHITKVIAVSESVRKYSVEKNIFPKNKIETIYNGIKPKTITNLKKMSDSNKQKLIIGSIGTLTKLKGQRYLIEAFKNLKSSNIDFQLEIVGSGQDERHLLKQVKKLNLQDKIRFLGQLNDIDKVMENWDIYVQPSISESFGLSVAEAMSMGIPVIATAAGGLSELVDGDSGILVNSKDSQALSCAIIKLGLNPKLRSNLGLHAKNRIEKYFSLNDMVKKTERLYEKIVKICS
jgi:glycosyltransferase involved in cell wall biosynthesis